jgi:hypothetical protein
MKTAIAVLANALQAIETQGQGFIRIACRKETPPDEGAKAFSGMTPGIYARLTVEYNGKGMQEETRNRVYEPFFVDPHVWTRKEPVQNENDLRPTFCNPLNGVDNAGAGEVHHGRMVSIIGRIDADF